MARRFMILNKGWMSNTMLHGHYPILQAVVLSMPHVFSKNVSFSLITALVEALSSLLFDENPCLVEKSICVLSNIIANGPVYREFVLRSNILSALNQPFNQHLNSIHVMKQLSLMLKNICQNDKIGVSIEYVPKIIPMLDVLIAHMDDSILCNALSAITHLTDSSSDHASLLISSGIINKLYKFLGASNKHTVLLI
ncbi:Importin subunit alpha-1 [Thelohanellus kitauei]|uniref:Importin subunit alpha-1 n=1 Tax=Thelohanellus kitauei TaxID=669202 RepID=A0A0C2I9G9_THEKT|nr:Importin subunit alpha-1 [Thelohanellus kitauei]